jgi:PAS domain S-box-containing protein
MPIDESGARAGARKGRLPKPAPLRRIAGASTSVPQASVGARREETFRMALEMMKEGFVITDGRGIVIFASAPFAKMMGSSPDDLRGQSFFGFFDPAQRDQVAGVFRSDATPARFACEAMFARLDGQTMPVRVELKRIDSAESASVGGFAVVTEISWEMQVAQTMQRSARELQRVSCQVLTAQESERQRIAADLHDGLGQLLGAVKFGLESVLGSSGVDGRDEPRRTLEIVTSTVKEALEEVRRLAMNLRPSTLDDLGLLATLTWFFREFQSVYRTIAVEMDFRIAECEVPDSLKVAMFRIVQESMSNIAKHSQATRVKVCLERDEGGIRLTLEDNGVGFNPSDVATRQGVQKRHGHVSSRDRVEWSGGTFAIRAAPGSGVCVRASWPTNPTALGAEKIGDQHAGALAHHDRRGPHSAQDGIACAPDAGSGS